MSSCRLGVVTALAAEHRALTGRSGPPGIFSDPDSGLLVSLCGIGPAAALRAARQLTVEGAEALVSWGSCAGLSEATVPGQLFLPRTVIDEGGQQHFNVDPAWHARLFAVLEKAGMTVHTGPLVSVTAMLTGRQAKARLHRQTTAEVADMESAAVAAVAAEAGCPYLCVRVVADTLEVMLPAAIVPALNAHGQPRHMELMRQLWRQPALIPQLIRLGRAFSRAQRTLAAVARLTGRQLAYGD